MALKPVSVYMLEDTFVCQGCYLPDDTTYREYNDKDRTRGKKWSELKQTKLRTDARAKA